jgi:hypothetical protein
VKVLPATRNPQRPCENCQTFYFTLVNV